MNYVLPAYIISVLLVLLMSLLVTQSLGKVGGYMRGGMRGAEGAAAHWPAESWKGMGGNTRRAKGSEGDRRAKRAEAVTCFAQVITSSPPRPTLL